MRIPSSEVPQADILTDVVRTAEAVRGGARTFQAIARHIGKVGRQGRYYRLAAEILGLITNYHNYAELTSFGESFLNASSQERSPLLLRAVLNARLFQRMLPFLERHPEGVTKEQLQDFMSGVTESVGGTMMPRRANTVINWLETIEVLHHHGGRYSLADEMPTDVPLLEFADSEPLLPRSDDLREYVNVESRITMAETAVQFMRNQAAVERALQEHNNLVNLVATRLRAAGALPRCNQLIDLAALMINSPYIFEMKSITSDNARSQIRLGLSQLYEYRYLQDLPQAVLVLVVGTSLPEELLWIQDYLEIDRQIRLLWDGDDELYASPATREAMAFLW